MTLHSCPVHLTSPAVDALLKVNNKKAVVLDCFDCAHEWHLAKRDCRFAKMAFMRSNF